MIRKKILSEKIFGPKNIFGPKKNFGPKIILEKVLGAKKIFGPKKNLARKRIFGMNKTFVGKKICPKIFFGLKQDFGREKNF